MLLTVIWRKMKPKINRLNPHWAAYLAASEKAAAAKRRPFELTDMTGICLLWFWTFATCVAAIIGWLLIAGWR